MTDLTFCYSGRQLKPLLARLLAQHDAELARLDTELAKFTPAQRAASASPSMAVKFAYDKAGNLMPQQQAPSEVAIVEHARVERLVAQRETQLWLLECYRTPNTRWLLTLRDLGRLYPEQTATESLATFQAEASSLSRLLGFLAAAIAGWLAPFRPSRLGPSRST